MTGIAQLASALALLLSFALMRATRRGGAVRLCVLQGCVAALAAGIQAWVHAAPQLAFVALLAGALNGVAMPLVLKCLGDRSGTEPILPKGHNAYTPVVAIVLATLSVAAAMHARAGTDIPALASGLSVLLLGLLLVTTDRYRDVPAVGLLSAQNGIVLAASAVPGLPAVAFLVCAVPFIAGLLAVGMWLRRVCQSSLASQ